MKYCCQIDASYDHPYTISRSQAQCSGIILNLFIPIHQPCPASTRPWPDPIFSYIVVSYGIGVTVSGGFLVASTVRASRGIAGCLFSCTKVPSALAFCFFKAFSLTLLRNSSRDLEWLMCSILTLTRFSM